MGVAHKILRALLLVSTTGTYRLLTLTAAPLACITLETSTGQENKIENCAPRWLGSGDVTTSM